MKARPVKIYRVGIKGTIMLLSLSYLILSPHRCVSDWGRNKFNPGDSQEVPPRKWYIMFCLKLWRHLFSLSLLDRSCDLDSLSLTLFCTPKYSYYQPGSPDTGSWRRALLILDEFEEQDDHESFSRVRSICAAWQYLRYCKNPTTTLLAFSKWHY